MTKTISRCATFAGILALIAGCSAVRSPITPTTAGPAPEPAPAPTCSGSTLFSPVTAPARVYVAASSCPSPSRYVLYDDGTFEMAYTNQLDNPYRGTFTEANGSITFTWQAASLAGPWGATGVITDDSLAVSYNLTMQLTDFVDAVYTRVR